MPHDTIRCHRRVLEVDLLSIDRTGGQHTYKCGPVHDGYCLGIELDAVEADKRKRPGDAVKLDITVCRIDSAQRHTTITVDVIGGVGSRPIPRWKSEYSGGRYSTRYPSHKLNRTVWRLTETNWTYRVIHPSALDYRLSSGANLMNLVQSNSTGATASGDSLAPTDPACERAAAKIQNKAGQVGCRIAPRPAAGAT
jgi:hypothetical protein